MLGVVMYNGKDIVDKSEVKANLCIICQHFIFEKAYVQIVNHNVSFLILPSR